MRKILTTLFLSLVLLISACGNDKSEETLSKEEVKERVHHYSVMDSDQKEKVQASIDQHNMIVKDNNGKVIETLKLPEDEFFLSIAPFESFTHPCDIHSLSGCQGELVEKDVHVKVVDDKDNIIIDEDMKTMKNGFIDLWLPRNQEFSVTVSDSNSNAQEILSTYDDSRTCITTMQLTE